MATPQNTPAITSDPTSIATANAQNLASANALQNQGSANPNANPAMAGKPGYDVFGVKVAGTPLSSGGALAPSSAVISNEGIINNVKPSLDDKLSKYGIKGAYIDTDGTWKYADGSVYKTPEQVQAQSEADQAQVDVDTQRQSLVDLKAQVR